MSDFDFGHSIYYLEGHAFIIMIVFLSYILVFLQLCPRKFMYVIITATMYKIYELIQYQLIS
jgi:hypothetical protein